jgi:cytochrome bd-type quinol oxidase subunit 1
MGSMLLRTSSVEAAYLGGVCVILILKAWQVSKGQQSSTALNAKQVAYVDVFLV